MEVMFFQDLFICFILQLPMERSIWNMRRRRTSMSKYCVQCPVLRLVNKVAHIAFRGETSSQSSGRDVFLFRAAISSGCPSFSVLYNSPQLCNVWERNKRNSEWKHSKVMDACLLINITIGYFIIYLIFSSYSHVSSFFFSGDRSSWHLLDYFMVRNIHK